MTREQRIERRAERQAVRDAREEIKQAMELALAYAPDILRQLAADALNLELEPKDRQAAAKLLLDRAMGGDPQAAVAVFAGVEREAARLNLNVLAAQPADLVTMLDAVLGRKRLTNGEP